MPLSNFPLSSNHSSLLLQMGWQYKMRRDSKPQHLPLKPTRMAQCVLNFSIRWVLVIEVAAPRQFWKFPSRSQDICQKLSYKARSTTLCFLLISWATFKNSKIASASPLVIRYIKHKHQCWSYCICPWICRYRCWGFLPPHLQLPSLLYIWL